jgi:hypothetical protein
MPGERPRSTARLRRRIPIGAVCEHYVFDHLWFSLARPVTELCGAGQLHLSVHAERRDRTLATQLGKELDLQHRSRRNSKDYKSNSGGTERTLSKACFTSLIGSVGTFNAGLGDIDVGQCSRGQCRN